MNDEYSSRDEGDKRRRRKRRMAANVKQQQQQKTGTFRAMTVKWFGLFFFFFFLPFVIRNFSRVPSTAAHFDSLSLSFSDWCTAIGRLGVNLMHLKSNSERRGCHCCRYYYYTYMGGSCGPETLLDNTQWARQREMTIIKGIRGGLTGARQRTSDVPYVCSCSFQEGRFIFNAAFTFSLSLSLEQSQMFNFRSWLLTDGPCAVRQFMATTTKKERENERTDIFLCK